MGRGMAFLGRHQSFGILNVSRRWFQMHSVSGPTKEEMAGVKQDLFGQLCSENIREMQRYPVPAINNPKVRMKRSALFSKEKDRQLQSVGRIEKIKVEYQGLPDPSSLIMNKNISTPFHCAQHLGQMLVDRSVVAEVNGQVWDMHRPLEENCTLQLLHMKMKDVDPYQVNRVFWRSCSFMLGAVCETAFRDNVYVELHSFPSPNVRSGSFVYDVDLKLKNWVPNSDEMRVLSSEMIKLSRKNIPFERLEIDVELALEMFNDNKYKKEQIPEIVQSSANGKTICVYRLGDCIDISRGPMMTHTGHLSKCTITSVHPLPQSKNISETLYRIQGVALPAGFLLNHFAYGLIEQRGRKFNTARVPGVAQSQFQSPTSTSLPSLEESEEKRQAMLV